MTKVYYNKDVYLKDISNAPWFILDTFDYVEDKLHVYYYNTPFTQILDQHVPLNRKLLNSEHGQLHSSIQYIALINENKRSLAEVNYANKRSCCLAMVWLQNFQTESFM